MVISGSLGTLGSCACGSSAFLTRSMPIKPVSQQGSCWPVTPEVAGSSPARTISLDGFRSPFVDQADDEADVSKLKNGHCKNSPAERLPDGASCHVGPDRNDERRCEHAHQKLRKIHNGPAPMFRRFRRLSNRQLKSPPLHFAKRRAPIAPRSPGAMDAPGIADSAIAVPDMTTHYGTPMRMAQDRIAD